MDGRNEIAANLRRFIETTEMRKIMKNEKSVPSSEESPKIEEINNDDEQFVAYAYTKDDKRVNNSFYDAIKHAEKRVYSQTNSNPLEKYFRRPGIAIKLPSQGHYNEDLNLLPTGEVTIFPLTAKDEIWLRNPDALLNGTAIVEIIKSCCPAVRNINVMNMVVNDINAILMGIQRASYGSIIEAKNKCVFCSKENLIKIDMDFVLSQIEFLDDAYAYVMEKNILVKGSEEISKMNPDLILFLEPTRYSVLVPYTLVTFEEAKIVQILEKTEMNKEEKEKEIYERLNRIHEINLKFMTGSISHIVTPEGDVIDDKNLISEFVLNMPLHAYKNLERHISYINSIGVPDKWAYECVHCHAENSVDIKYDPQNFL